MFCRSRPRMNRSAPWRTASANSTRPTTAPATPTTTASTAPTSSRNANSVTTAVVATSEGTVFSAMQIPNRARSGSTARHGTGGKDRGAACVTLRGSKFLIES